jgi:phenylalanyl-tRNA synthetase alpha chain
LIELRENEYKIFSLLKEIKSIISVDEISRRTKLNKSTVIKALLNLSKNQLVEIIEEKNSFLRVNEEGLTYTQIGLPENRLVEAAISAGGVIDLDEAVKSTHIEKKMVPIVLGWIKKKGLATIDRKKDRILLMATNYPRQGSEEKLLQILSKEGEMNFENLSDEIKKTSYLLKRRNLIEEFSKIKRFVKLSNKGHKVTEKSVKMIDGATALDSKMITSGEWKKVKLLEYDVTSSPPVIYPGKRHFFSDFIDEGRRILLRMGFEEYDGPYVEEEFWNFDVLFQPQDHPAREIHDSYIIKKPRKGIIENTKLMERVKKTHENGWTTGSRGWKYKWSPDITRRLVLRTQTTAVSMRYLSKHKKPPIKMFCISKVFRPDVLDAKHSMEFTQLEGIIGDKNITLRHLLGLLKRFAKALGLGEVKFRPGYFPFTEPSVESFVKHPKLGWVEFVGAGMFRPEVCKPLDIKFPVIAWGIGFDRLAMIRLGVDDIRELYSKRLSLLRERTF